jgi:hypothetical protein
MYFYLVAFGLLLHVLFWGAGLAMVAMPVRWRKFWPVLMVPAGFALQSLMVWLGAYADLKGTNSYAWASEAVPVLLLVGAIWRRGLRAIFSDLSRWCGLGGLMALVLVALIWPLAHAAKGLTTTSLGSCDAADYAAGARVLMDFAHGERGGFLGLTEVVRVATTDNFFDFWLRLNHFTPSALIALNGTIFNCAPYELTGLMTMVLLAGSLPVVFWMARAVLGYRGSWSLVITVLYGISPITWYAVAHVAMGQLLAAQAIALLTWAGVAQWRGRFEARRVWSFAWVLALGYALILGSYNFILLVSLAPALAYAGGLALWRGQWRRLVAWILIMVVPLVLAGVIFWERVAGLAERLVLFQQFDFGWKIPLLTPAGWLGMVATPELSAWPLLPGIGLALVTTAMWCAALVRGAKLKRRSAYVALCLLVPPLIGYAYLHARGIYLGTNASYDAYKILAVFYPGILAAMMYWITLEVRGWWGGLVAAFAVLTVGLNLLVANRFERQLENPPLMVGRELLELKKIEPRSDVTSLNLLVPDMWSRLWANSLLLKKPQYFETHTYEGRLNTPLRGAWDLNGGLIALRLPDGGSERIGPHFSIANTKHPYFLRARLGDGWYAMEQLPRSPVRWNWTRGDATLRMENPQDRPLRVVAYFNARCEGPRELQLWLNGQLVRTVQLTENLNVVRVPEITVPVGASVLELRLSPALAGQLPSQGRPLGLALYGLEMEVKRDTDATEI